MLLAGNYSDYSVFGSFKAEVDRKFRSVPQKLHLNIIKLFMVLIFCLLRILSAFATVQSSLHKPLSMYLWCCIEMQYVTWLIPSVEQMSDVQMCMWVLLLLAVRAVGEVSLLLYPCLCANGCFYMHVRWQIMYFPILCISNVVYVPYACVWVCQNQYSQCKT